ncbi:MAG: hypothetical protein IPL40_09960 [Proteobacteria bacterium]|nr:hypothetical protein [Pseudomonadota bacterium]
MISQSKYEVRRQVRATRRQQGLGFVLIVDGDNVGWRNRLDTLVGKSGSREQGDRRAVWAPTWSVETWVLYLCDEKLDDRVVDESRSFKQTIAQRGGFTQDLLRQAATAWDSGVSALDARHPASMLPSPDDTRASARRTRAGAGPQALAGGTPRHGSKSI